MNSKKFYALLFSAIMVIGIASPFMFAAPASAQTQKVTPTIKITLLTPGANPERRQHALLITNNLNDLGMQAQRVLVPFSPDAYSRALDPAAADIGKTYDQGGFDVLFVGYAMSPDPNPYALFDSSQFPPSGQNYYLWNDSTNDALCQAIIHETNATARKALLWQWQEYAYQQIPDITLFSTKEVVAFTPTLDWKPFSLYHYPAWPGVEQWNYTSGTATSVTIAQTGPAGPAGQGLSVYHSTSYYDLTVSGCIYGELAGYDIFTRATDWSMIPLMAYSNYSVSPRWLNFTIKPNIYFQNGEVLDGRDFVATLRAQLTPAWGAATESYVQGILGTDAMGYGNKSMWYAGETGTNGSGMALNYNNVFVHLPADYAYVLSDIGGATVYPASILVNSSTYNWAGSAFIQPNAASLKGFAYTSFNTGGTGAYGYYSKTNGSLVHSVGPVGAGPYQWVGYDSTTYTCHLTKFTNYFNTANLTAAGVYKINNYYVRYIEALAPAITALQAGDVQVLDSQYSLPGSLSLLAPAWSNYTAYNAFGLQEMGFNMRHPVFGTGVDTPLGQEYPAMAAAAAAHVRRAIEYMIPKDQIIKTLLNGYGAFGVTTAVLPPMAGGVFDTSITIRNVTAADAMTRAELELRAAGYDIVPVVTPGFFETYGLLLSVVELAVIVVIAGFYFYKPRKA